MIRAIGVGSATSGKKTNHISCAAPRWLQFEIRYTSLCRPWESNDQKCLAANPGRCFTCSSLCSHELDTILSSTVPLVCAESLWISGKCWPKVDGFSRNQAGTACSHRLCGPHRACVWWSLAMEPSVRVVEPSRSGRLSDRVSPQRHFVVVVVVFTKFLARNIWPTGYSMVLIVRARGRKLGDDLVIKCGRWS